MGTSVRGRRQFVDTRRMSDAEVALLLADDPREPAREPAAPRPVNPDQAWEVALREWWSPTVPLAEWPPVVLWAYLQRALAATEPAERPGFRDRAAVHLARCAAAISPLTAADGFARGGRTGSA